MWIEGFWAPGFWADGFWVANRPVLVSAATNPAGTQVLATFDKSMADPAGKHGQFSLDLSGSPRSFSAAALGVTDDIIALTVDGDPITALDVATLDYAPGDVLAADGGVLAAFSDQPVTNLTGILDALSAYAGGRVYVYTAEEI